GFGNVFGKRTKNHFAGTLRRSGQSFGGRSSEMHAFAGFADIDSHQTDGQGQRSDNLEINQRLQSQPADLLQVGVTSDAHHQGGKNKRGNDGANEAKKNLTQNAQAHGQSGQVVTQHDSQKDADENPSSERPPAESPINQQQHNRQPSEKVRPKRDGQWVMPRVQRYGDAKHHRGNGQPDELPALQHLASLCDKSFFCASLSTAVLRVAFVSFVVRFWFS